MGNLKESLNNRFHKYGLLYLFFVFSLVVFFTSCGINQDVYLKSDGSGNINSTIIIKPIFVDYLKSMAEVTGESEKLKDGNIFDVDEIKKTMEKRPGVTVKKIESPTPEKLVIQLHFASIETVFNSEKELSSAGLITFLKTKKGKLLKLHLDKKNFKQLISIFPELSNPIVESMGPQEDENITESEYLEMIQFALGEKGPEAVEKSSIKLLIHIDGKLISQSGGKVIGKNSVLFKLPLIKVLLLNDPIDYSILFD